MPPAAADWPARPRLAAELSSAAVSLEDEATWDGVEVAGSFAGETASLVDIAGCRLIGAVFTGAEIDRLRLTDTLIEDCELSGVVLSRLAAIRVEFRRCRLSSLVATSAEMKDVHFTDCKLDEANFRMTTWARSAFESCLLTDADFGSAKFDDVRLRTCDLTAADFSKAKLSNTSFHGSKLDGVRGADAFRGAVIGTDQILPLALSVFSALAIRIDDTPDP